MTMTPAHILAMWETLRTSGRDLAVLAPIADAYAEEGDDHMAACLRWCWEKRRRPRKATYPSEWPPGKYHWFLDTNSHNQLHRTGYNNRNGPSNLPDELAELFGEDNDTIQEAYEKMGCVWEFLTEEEKQSLADWSPTLKPRKVYG